MQAKTTANGMLGGEGSYWGYGGGGNYGTNSVFHLTPPGTRADHAYNGKMNGIWELANSTVARVDRRREVTIRTQLPGGAGGTFLNAGWETPLKRLHVVS